MTGAQVRKPESGKDLVLKRLARQLDHLAAEVHRIEHAIGDGLAVSDLRDSDTVQRLQRLDYLRQSLEDMALLSLFLSDAGEDPCHGDLAPRLRLEATRQLLDPRGVHAVKPAPPLVGDVDLF